MTALMKVPTKQYDPRMDRERRLILTAAAGKLSLSWQCSFISPISTSPPPSSRLRRAMILRTRGTLCATQAQITHALPLFDFLVPAFSRATLSTTTRCNSRVGAAILSVPEQVKLSVYDPPPSNPNIISRTPPPKSIHIDGPLGSLPSRRHVSYLFVLRQSLCPTTGVYDTASR